MRRQYCDPLQQASTATQSSRRNGLIYVQRGVKVAPVHIKHIVHGFRPKVLYKNPV